MARAGGPRGRSSMVEPQSSKLATRVRFPSPAPPLTRGYALLGRSWSGHMGSNVVRTALRCRDGARFRGRSEPRTGKYRGVAERRHARVGVRGNRPLDRPPALPQGDRQGGPEGPARGRGRSEPVAEPGRREAQPAHRCDRRPAPDALPRPVRRLAEHVGALPHARPQPHLAMPRARQGSASSTRRPSTPFTASSAGAGAAARASGRSSTGSPSRTSATTAASGTSASRWPRRLSGTFTSSCPAPSSARSDGDG